MPERGRRARAPARPPPRSTPRPWEGRCRSRRDSDRSRSSPDRPERVQRMFDIGDQVGGVLEPDLEAHEGAVMIRRAERAMRSEEHTSELQSLMRISYAVCCLKKKKNPTITTAVYNPTRINQLLST